MEPFTSPHGPVVPLSFNPLELFSHFFDSDVIELIVREMNRYMYATQCRGDNTLETNAEEIRAYLGFQVLMGINQLPEVRDYWAKDQRLHYSPIADRTSRLRFEEVSRCLHFVDNATLPARGEDGHEGLQKIHPIITAVRQRCLGTYRPGVHNSIDEAMIPFKGEHTNSNT